MVIISFTAKCAIEKRNTPPGPRVGMMRKLSEYGRRLREKQKLRFSFGLMEKLDVLDNVMDYPIIKQVVKTAGIKRKEYVQHGGSTRKEYGLSEC